MTEILNLNSLCRCCHVHGKFQDLRSKVDGVLDTYTDVLQQTFGVLIKEVDLSYTICEECIQQLKHSWRFKTQLMNCENKFQEYYTNESVKSEINHGDGGYVFIDSNLDYEIEDPMIISTGDVETKDEKKTGDGDDMFIDSNLDRENEAPEGGNVKVEGQTGIKSRIAKKAKKPPGRPKKIKRGRKPKNLTQAEQHRAAVRQYDSQNTIYALKKRLANVPMIISTGEVERKDEKKTGDGDDVFNDSNLDYEIEDPMIISTGDVETKDEKKTGDGDDVFIDSNLDRENEAPEGGDVKVEGIKSKIAKKAKRPPGRPKKIKPGPKPRKLKLSDTEQLCESMIHRTQS